MIVSLWNLETGACVNEFSGHKNRYKLVTEHFPFQSLKCINIEFNKTIAIDVDKDL